MFKNVMMYRLTQPWGVAPEQLQEALARAPFVACGASQEKSVGWVAPRGVAHAPLLEQVGGQWILKLQQEVKVLPSSVVKRKADEQAAQIEASTGRKPGKKELRNIREDTRHALLPMAFTKQASTWVWLDPVAGWLVLDCANQNRADEVLTFLVKAVNGLAVQPIHTQMSPAAAMAVWLSSHEAPSFFTVDNECELKAADASKAVVRYTRHPLDTEEVSQHIAQGKMPTRLALTWRSAVSFVLTEGLQLKRVALVDGALEAPAALASDTAEDRFDTDVVLVTAQLQQLIPDLIEALGGQAQ